ncbi:MAG: hypothetical protein AABX72_00320 [Nanoarchaeota archaeon]
MAQYKETKRDKEWHSYTGTGITAEKGNDAIALREAVGGGKFAVVKLHGGCWTNSAVEVLEEIDTSDVRKASVRFDVIVQQQGFATKPVRGIGILLGTVLQQCR